MALQPLDKAMIRAFELSYRKHVAEQFLVKLLVNDKLKNNLLAAIERVSCACQDVA